MSHDNYHPVSLNIAATRERWQRDAAFADAYTVLADEFALLSEMLRARHEAGLTQAEVAERMGVKQSSVARLESSAGSRKHAPSLVTLRRYGDALGCDVRLTLVPKGEPNGNRT